MRTQIAKFLESPWGEHLVGIGHRLMPLAAIVLLVVTMGGTWHFADAAPQSIADAAAASSRSAAGHGGSHGGAGSRGSGASGPRTGTGSGAAVASGGGTAVASGSRDAGDRSGALERPAKKSARELTGKLNLNTATEAQLMLLPTVGPAKAERIVTWRKKNGGFRRAVDLRRVKGFGYKTFKRLEAFVDITGETTLQ